jgi:hypothetical protein
MKRATSEAGTAYLSEVPKWAISSRKLKKSQRIQWTQAKG